MHDPCFRQMELSYERRELALVRGLQKRPVLYRSPLSARFGLRSVRSSYRALCSHQVELYHQSWQDDLQLWE